LQQTLQRFSLQNCRYLHGISFRPTCFGARPRTSRQGSCSAGRIKDRTRWRRRIGHYSLTPLSVRSLSKIAHIYDCDRGRCRSRSNHRGRRSTLTSMLRSRSCAAPVGSGSDRVISTASRTGRSTPINRTFSTCSVLPKVPQNVLSLTRPPASSPHPILAGHPCDCEGSERSVP
jgi:hypothetical protein